MSVPLLDDANRFKLAVFALNVSGGLSATTATGTIRGGDWNEVKTLAIAADQAGFDALVPIARWKGYGGITNWNDRSFETFTWAAGLAAVTERIQLFATVQVPTIHPIRAAKEAVTVDHISGGRFGLNIVAGWNPAEHRMFGHIIRDHDERYAVAAEFAALLRRLWSEDEFDHDGIYFQLAGAHSAPRPLQRPGPLLMSAGGSPAGSEFAAANADIQFLNLQTPVGAADLVKGLRKRARSHGRTLRIMTCAYIICRDTEAEAHDYFAHVVHERGDRHAAVNMVEALAPDSSFMMTPDVLDQVCAGFGAIPLIGTPDQVAASIQSLSEAGLDGAALSWIDYADGIAQYRDKLFPRLCELGLRSRHPIYAQ